MKQEEKDLLLKDLCARLPYGDGVKVEYNGEKYKIANVSICNETITIYGERGYPMEVEIKKVKPYLFPLSSMTEEQKKEYRKVCDLDMEILENRPMKGEPFPAMFNSQDWLDAHHFDYRGLIPMGLANDATGLNIY